MMFSIVVPLYNKAPYLARALDAVLAQSFSDWSLIIIDDGSTDESAAIAERYVGPKVTLIRQENQGVGETRNRGAALAPTDYICFLDADDWWEPDHLARLAALIKTNPEAGIFSTRFVTIDSNDLIHQPYLALASDHFGVVDNFIAEYGRSRSLIQMSSCCLAKSALIEMGGFPLNSTSGEDVYVWLEIARRHQVLYDAHVSATYATGVPHGLGSGNDSKIPYPLEYYLRDQKLPEGEKDLRALVLQLALIQIAFSASKGRTGMALTVVGWMMPYSRKLALRGLGMALAPRFVVKAAWRGRNFIRSLRSTHATK